MLPTLIVLAAAALPGPVVQPARAQLLVESMKKNPRGPYAGVAWFCHDGTTQPPKSGACKDRGGGRQHGVLSADAKTLAADGIHVGTVLSALTPEDLVTADLYRARALVVERFLERTLDGWVLVSAKGYRGARQIEEEEAAAITLLQALAGDRRYADANRNVVLRLIRALPYGAKDSTIDDIRALASQVGDVDRRFEPIRGKIHSLPEASDVDRVAAYLPTASKEAKDAATELLTKLRAHYDMARRNDALMSVKKRIAALSVRRGVDELRVAVGAVATIRAATNLLGAMSQALHDGPAARRPSRNLILLYGMGLVEERLVDTLAALSKTKLNRRTVIAVLDQLVEAARVLGMLSTSERAAAAEAVAAMLTGDPASYARGVDRVGLILEWGRARHAADFGLPMQRYMSAEPGTRGLLDDLLRSGVLMPASALVDRLSRDLEELRGGGHVVVEAEPTAVRGVNSGYAVGVLRVLAPGADPSGLKRNEIVLLDELGPDLPPVAGIITLGTTSSLSHVSLLAQNLGLPHVAVTDAAARTIEQWAGRTVVVGVSISKQVLLGPVELLPADIKSRVETAPRAKGPVLEVDAARLDLRTTTIRDIAQVHEKEAGIRVGPKAAELGRLERLFPERVSDAVVIPFGAFVKHVDRADGGASPLERLRRVYADAAKLDEAEREARVLAALAAFRASIETLPFPDGFAAEVEAALARLGAPGTFGVFVRSDTNVEDLKDFTGAGLNLTVPNRVGLPSVLRSIRDVWGSPFSERSYRWRQQLLANPEHVYPSVLLHKTVPSEVSGVIITADLETGARDALTISVSEGVAAVVDGGSAETIVIEASGKRRLLSSSRIFVRRRIPPPPQEGVVTEAAARTDPLLDAAAINEIAGLVKEVRRAVGEPGVGVAWDIELGLLDGRAWLFQIRPLKASKLAAAHPLLLELDRRVKLPEKRIDLEEELP